MPIKVEGKNKKVILSYSSYAAYEMCPLRYKREKIDREKVGVRDDTFATPGLILHKSAEDYLKSKGEDNTFDADFLKEKILQAAESPTVDFERGYGSVEKVINMVTTSGNFLEEFLYTKLRFGFKLLSEYWFGTWDSPVDVTDRLSLQGAIDLLEFASGASDVVIPYDFKTTYTDKYLNSDQLVLYSAALELKSKQEGNPLFVQMASFFLLPLNKQHFMHISDLQKKSMLVKLDKIAGKILKGKFEATPGEHCVKCPYNGICSSQRDFSTEREIIKKEVESSIESFGDISL